MKGMYEKHHTKRYMKIIQINSTLKSGSTGKLMYQIHEYLDQNNINNKIIFAYGDKKDLCGYKIYNFFSVHIHSYLSRKFSMQGKCSWLETLRVLRFLKREKPSIIHLHNIHGHYLNYKILFWYINKNNIPVVWTFHDCWPYTGKCSHYASVNCEKWKTGCYQCDNLECYPDSTFDGSSRDYYIKKQCFTSTQKLNIVCNSDWLKSQVEESFFKGKKIKRIYNGVDNSVFKPTINKECYKKYKININKKIIIGVSSVWKAQKGLDTFIKLAKKLDESYQIIMVGINNEQKKILPENIISISKTEDMQELAELYSVSMVCLNASTEETFGMVTVEAMACGTPVIVSNTTACPEVVDKRTGIVVDMNKIEDIISAIDLIRKKGKDYYKSECIKKVSENFTILTMCKKYYELYNEIIRQEKGEENV